MCDSIIWIEPSKPFGDVPCPRCGGLIWFVETGDELLVFDSREARQIRNEIRQLAADQLEWAELISPAGPWQRFWRRAIGNDSLDQLELIYQVETHFKVDVEPMPERRKVKITSTDEYVDYLTFRILEYKHRE